MQRLLFCDFLEFFFLYSIFYFQDRPALKIIDHCYFCEVANSENQQEIKNLFSPVYIYIYIFMYVCMYVYISGAEIGLVLLVPGTTNNLVNVIQNGLKIIH